MDWEKLLEAFMIGLLFLAISLLCLWVFSNLSTKATFAILGFIGMVLVIYKKLK